MKKSTVILVLAGISFLFSLAHSFNDTPFTGSVYLAVTLLLCAIAILASIGEKIIKILMEK